jgi:hypothetical protein
MAMTSATVMLPGACTAAEVAARQQALRLFSDNGHKHKHNCMRAQLYIMPGTKFTSHQGALTTNIGPQCAQVHAYLDAAANAASHHQADADLARSVELSLPVAALLTRLLATSLPPAKCSKRNCTLRGPGSSDGCAVRCTKHAELT